MKNAVIPKPTSKECTALLILLSSHGFDREEESWTAMTETEAKAVTAPCRC